MKKLAALLITLGAIAFATPTLAQSADLEVPVVKAVRFEGHTKKRLDPKTGKLVDFKDAKEGADGAYQWAYAADLDVLAAIFPNEKMIKTFNEAGSGNSGKLSNQNTTGVIPNTIMHKKVGEHSFFVVHSRQAQVFQCYDAKTLKLTASMSCQAGRVTYSTEDTNPESPFVYFIWYHAADNESLLGRFDLRNYPEIPTVGKKTSLSNIGDYAIAPDGKHCYYYATEDRQWHLRYAELVNGKDGAFSFKDLRSVQVRDRGRLRIDPSNRFVFARGVYFAPGLRGRLVHKESAKGTLLLDRALCVELGYGGLLSFNDFTKAGVVVKNIDVQLPRGKNFADPSPEPPYEIGRVFVHQNLSSGKLIICTRSILVVCSLKELKIPSPKFASYAVDGPSEVATAKEVRWKIVRVGDPGEPSLKAGPKGAVLKGDEIVWTPNEDSIGAVAMHLELKKGDEISRRQFAVRVIRKHSSLPFKAREIEHSPNGRLLLLKSKSQFQHNDEEQPARLAIFDVVSGKTIATTTIKGDFHAATLSDEFTAIALKGTSTISIRSNKDLKEVKSVIYRESFKSLRFVENQALLIGAGGRRVLSLPAFKRVREGRLFDLFNIESLRSNHREFQTKEVWLQDGVLIGGQYLQFAETGTPTTLIPDWVQQFYNTAGVSLNFPRLNQDRRHNQAWTRLYPWSPVPFGDNPRNDSFKEFGTLGMRVLANEPVVIGLGLEEKYITLKEAKKVSANQRRWGQGGAERVRVTVLALHFKSIKSGKLLKTINVSAIRDDQSGRDWDNESGATVFFEQQGKICVVYEERCYTIPTPSFSEEEASIPLAFAMKEGAPIVGLDADKPVYVEYQLRGDTEGLVVTSVKFPSGLSFSTEHRSLRINAKKARTSALELFQKYVPRLSDRDLGGGRGQRNMSAAETLEKIKALFDVKCARLVERKKGQLLIPLSFQIALENEVGEGCDRVGTIYVELPDEEAKSAILRSRNQGLPGMKQQAEQIEDKIEHLKKQLAEYKKEIAKQE